MAIPSSTRASGSTADTSESRLSDPVSSRRIAWGNVNAVMYEPKIVRPFSVISTWRTAGRALTRSDRHRANALTGARDAAHHLVAQHHARRCRVARRDVEDRKVAAADAADAAGLHLDQDLAERR